MSDEQIEKKVRVDLEIDVNQKPESKNPFNKWVYFARTLDAYRIFPRIFIGVYITLFYQSVTWFMSLDDPTTQQASLISVITSIGAAWFTAYVATGSKKSKDE